MQASGARAYARQRKSADSHHRMNDKTMSDVEGAHRRVPRKISWWHLVYVVLLLLTVLVCVIVCLSRESVCDAAMDNVSFASAIVSIVLAVVSIVVSLYATFSTYSNLGSMEHVDRSIRRSLKHLRNIRKIAGDNNKQLQKLTAGSIIEATPREIALKQDEEIHEEEIQEGRTAKADDSPSSSTATVSQTDLDAEKLSIREITAEIVEKALEKICSIFGFNDMRRNYRPKLMVGVPMIFDGVVENPDGRITLFEIKSIAPGALQLTPLHMMRRRIAMLGESFDLSNAHVYIVLVFRGNDKDKYLSRYRRFRTLHDTPNLTILYFNLDEL